MFESLVITLREGIEAALAVGIVLIYLGRTGRRRQIWIVYAGLAAALVASLAAAALLANLPFNEEIFEGILMIGAAVLVVTMVCWMWRHGRRLKGDIEGRVGQLTSEDRGAAAGAGLFLFTFLMIFREGVETVLLLAAVNLTSEALLAFIGGLLGIVLAVLFGVAFVKGSVRIDLGRFFKVTGVVLLIFAAQLLVSGIHELAEAGWIRLGRGEMRIIGPVVKAESLFLAALLSIPLIVLLIPARASGPGTQPVSAPERRRILARARQERFWRVVACSAGLLVILSLTGSYAYTRLPRAVDPPRMLQGESGEIRLETAGLDDGHLHRFGVGVGGSIVRFLVMRGKGGTLATAFDACEVCGSKGYVEEKDRLVCIHCAADIVPSTIGAGGGCNPIPLSHRMEGNEMVVSLSELESRAFLFLGDDEGKHATDRPVAGSSSP